MAGYTAGAWQVAASAVNVPAGGTPTDLCTLDLSGVISAEVAIEWTYGTGATVAGRVLFERQTDGAPTYQTLGDKPWELAVPEGDGVTRKRVTVLHADRWPSVRLQAVNDEASLAATVTVRYRTITYA